jgi:hypothetical protein
MGRISSAICFILALLTVLSIAPVFLLSLACDFSPDCLVRGFGHFLIGPGGVRKPALAVMVGPIFVLLTYILVFLGCHRRRDVLDRDGRSLG